MADGSSGATGSALSARSVATRLERLARRASGRRRGRGVMGSARGVAGAEVVAGVCAHPGATGNIRIQAAPVTDRFVYGAPTAARAQHERGTSAARARHERVAATGVP